MTKKIFYKFVTMILVLLILSSCRNVTKYTYSETYNKINDIVSNDAQNTDFSGIIYITKGKSIIYNKSFYSKKNFADRRIDNNSTFMIGSLTKQFTAIAILILQSRGLLNINDPINKYFNQFPWGDDITLHHLLTHTAGLPRDPFYDYMIDEISADVFENYILQMIKDKNHLDFIIKSYNYDVNNKKYTIKPKISFNKKSQIMNILFTTCYISDTIYPNANIMIEELIKNNKLKLHSRPGVKYNYSNFGYIILGAIIEKVSGKTIDTFFYENIFFPLDMHNTGFGYDIKNNTKMLPGVTEYGEFIEKPINLKIWPAAAGGLYSSVKDISKWIDFLNDNRILPMSSKGLIYAKHIPIGRANYGYGVLVNDYSINNAHFTDINHSGFILSYNSSIHYIPELDIKIIILSNKSDKNYIQELWAKKIISLVK